MPGSNAQRGMTLIEVLAATVLSAILMVAVMGVLGGLRGHVRALELRDPTPSWQRSLRAALQSDFENASLVRLISHGFELEGIAGHDGTSTGAWLPQVVGYEIVESNEKRYLVRTSRPAGNLASNQAAANLVCFGVGAVEITGGSKGRRQIELTVKDGLVMRLKGTDGKPLFEFEYRAS